MTVAKNGNTVKVHYTGKLKDGTVFDSSLQRNEPLEFTLGQGNMIAGFEKAVDGMKVGDSTVADIPVGEAYGEVREDMILEVPKKDVPENITPEVGQRLAVQQKDGQSIPVTIAKVSEESITLDANHPLAGKDLVFEIELLEIK
ncbi:FKBP-type peptidyl-prolyl cis-trans isomerase [Catalinimonas niigatensis]|uniref:FKBP-type peptidyl-prolyl cis-trans isomerase n=1 Tax=Catalinimonas niigatensis TaxID=1397264 RepID=UPI0026661391|nr:peptidylprolyl isomerase [Catalinimonas niigatensis]WPP52558.1 peptidylprolyl isomerase [Catalinimonas niigatensis]